MALFGKKDKALQKTLPPEMPPSLSDADLAEASRLMDLWDSSLGNSDATWDCIEKIARRGGFIGSQGSLMEVMDGKSSEDVTQRPWRWWYEATSLAHARGDEVLAGRIFLFTHLFTVQIGPTMRPVDMMETGMDLPAEASYKGIATIAVNSLARLSPDLTIHDSSTGQVDVANALKMAEEVSGVTAPQVDPPPQWRPPDGMPFNSL